MDTTPARHTQGHEDMPPVLAGWPVHDKYQWTGKGELHKKCMAMVHVVNAAGVCLFAYLAYDWQFIPDFLRAVTREARMSVCGHTCTFWALKIPLLPVLRGVGGCPRRGPRRSASLLGRTPLAEASRPPAPRIKSVRWPRHPPGWSSGLPGSRCAQLRLPLDPDFWSAMILNNWMGSHACEQARAPSRRNSPRQSSRCVFWQKISAQRPASLMPVCKSLRRLCRLCTCRSS
jgi:hypothetical protein